MREPIVVKGAVYQIYVPKEQRFYHYVFEKYVEEDGYYSLRFVCLENKHMRMIKPTEIGDFLR